MCLMKMEEGRTFMFVGQVGVSTFVVFSHGEKHLCSDTYYQFKHGYNFWFVGDLYVAICGRNHL